MGDSHTKVLILDTISDAVADLLFYDRKEDEELPVDAIEGAVQAGVITVDEMVERFRAALVEALWEGG